MPRPLLSIVAPCFNEEQVLERFHAELRAVLVRLEHLEHEIVLVDDGSADGTLALIEELARRDPCVRVVVLPENRGQAQALAAGLRAARGDAVVTMDCDLQHPPELIPRMVRRWEQGDAIVSTIRTDAAELPAFKRLGTRLFYRMHDLVSQAPLQPYAPDFCLLTRAACDALDLEDRRFFLRGAVGRLGLQRTFLEFDAPARAAGETKYDARKMLALARDGLLSDPEAPARLALLAGSLLLAVALLCLPLLTVRAEGAAPGPAHAPTWVALALCAVGVLVAVLALASLPRSRGGRPLELGGALALVVVAGIWATVAWLPFFSETYIHLALGAAHDGPLRALGTAPGAIGPLPFRPLQWGFFQALVSAGLDQPAAARAITYGLHFLNALLVLSLVRAFGGARHTCLFAMLVFLAFPSAKSLVWIDAVSGPARTAFMLAGLLCVQHHLDRARAATGLGSLAALALALGFHQSAILLPALYLLLAWSRGRGRAALRDPWILAGLALCAAFAAYVGFVREGRYHGLKEPAAIAANGVRASLAFAPEWVRRLGVEGLRGQHGTSGTVLGALLVIAALLVCAYVIWRAAPVARALLVAAVADLVLPVLSTGFVTRYAYFGAALIAVALGVGFQASLARTRRARWIVAGGLALAFSWAWDQLVDLREQREAGIVVERILEGAEEARRALPVGRILVVNAPGTWGAEDDLPLFNWGLPWAIRRRGIAGEWGMLRSSPSWMGTDHMLVDEARLARVLSVREDPLLVFDRVTLTCTWLSPVERGR